MLCPFPFAADDHQTRNAEAMQRRRRSPLVRDADRVERAVTRCGRRAGARTASWNVWENGAPLRQAGAARRAADILEEVGK
jgi:UDP-N-acetylglucosamine--N-acetylmuramyl-(pentapeptide) pyrophosphoryl-undecaprenol N-acetylglucosamine transferase